jgi:diacylglycerol kinase
MTPKAFTRLVWATRYSLAGLRVAWGQQAFHWLMGASLSG